MALFLALVGLVRAVDNCRAPGEFVPGGTSQCDPSVDCEWCERNHESFDFLCCESGTWIGPHLTNPLLVYMVWADAIWTILLVVSVEIVERIIFMMDTGHAVFGDADRETLMSSVVGDVLIQGGLGLFLGYLLRSLFVMPILVSTVQKAAAHNLWGRRLLYIIIFLVQLVVSLVVSLGGASSTLRGGLLAHTLVQLFFIWVVWPLLLRIDDRDKTMIWTPDVHPTKRFGFFALWGITVILAQAFHVPGDQPLFSINEWYMNWLIMGSWTFLLVILTLAVSFYRSDFNTAGIVMGTVIFAVGLGLVVQWHVTDGTSPPSSSAWFGVALFVVAAIVWTVSSLSFSAPAPATVVEVPPLVVEKNRAMRKRIPYNFEM